MDLFASTLGRKHDPVPLAAVPGFGGFAGALLSSDHSRGILAGGRLRGPSFAIPSPAEGNWVLADKATHCVLFGSVS